MVSPTRIPLGLFGIVGSFAPSIIKMFNDLPNIAFVFKWEWAVVIALYGFLGGVVSVIFPYRGRPTPWKALLLGGSFPAIIGTAAAWMRPRGPGSSLGGEGAGIPWTALDFVSLF
jgi:hypothetical protein